jgi:hypothetical protein
MQLQVGRLHWLDPLQVNGSVVAIDAPDTSSAAGQIRINSSNLAGVSERLQRSVEQVLLEQLSCCSLP